MSQYSTIVDNLKKDIDSLQQELSRKKLLLEELKRTEHRSQEDSDVSKKLSKEDIGRFSRQIILPEVGVRGQLALKNSSVLIVGAGGLGCPAAQYLAGAGVGHIGIVDYDDVELSNLHRQLLHTESSIGLSKVESIDLAIRSLNSSIKVSKHHCQLTSLLAVHIIQNYDIVLDATDNVPTRYLLNDACIMLGKTLVSGSALKFEGQLTVYNYLNGPCYRCIFPTPPPPETVTNCGDGGVMGAVTGIIGTLQALETIKIILQQHDGILSGKLLLFDGSCSQFRTVKLRGKRPNCDVCSDKPIITRLIDYEEYCGMRATDKGFRVHILDECERISVIQLSEIIEKKQEHMLIDVRNSNEYEICRLNESINIPIRDILENRQIETIKNEITNEKLQVIVICRRGNDSQLAVRHIKHIFPDLSDRTKDVIGGLHEWSKLIDSSFPVY